MEFQFIPRNGDPNPFPRRSWLPRNQFPAALSNRCCAQATELAPTSSAAPGPSSSLAARGRRFEAQTSSGEKSQENDSGGEIWADTRSVEFLHVFRVWSCQRFTKDLKNMNSSSAPLPAWVHLPQDGWFQNVVTPEDRQDFARFCNQRNITIVNPNPYANLGEEPTVAVSGFFPHTPPMAPEQFFTPVGVLRNLRKVRAHLQDLSLKNGRAPLLHQRLPHPFEVDENLMKEDAKQAYLALGRPCKRTLAQRKVDEASENSHRSNVAQAVEKYYRKQETVLRRKRQAEVATAMLADAQDPRDQKRNSAKRTRCTTSGDPTRCPYSGLDISFSPESPVMTSSEQEASSPVAKMVRLSNSMVNAPQNVSSIPQTHVSPGSSVITLYDSSSETPGVNRGNPLQPVPFSSPTPNVSRMSPASLERSSLLDKGVNINSAKDVFLDNYRWPAQETARDIFLDNHRSQIPETEAGTSNGHCDMFYRPWQ